MGPVIHHVYTSTAGPRSRRPPVQTRQPLPHPRCSTSCSAARPSSNAESRPCAPDLIDALVDTPRDRQGGDDAQMDALVREAVPPVARAVLDVATSTTETESWDSVDVDSSSDEAPRQDYTWEDQIGPSSSFFDWKFDSRIHYVQRGSTGPAVLLVHGFGVGCYQYNAMLEDLSKDHRVWAVDLLGQGASWPAKVPKASDNLRYSLDTWTEQLADFTQAVIQKEPSQEEAIYVAGNSLGGLLSASLAYQHPTLVRGIILLNAAPFWSFSPRLDDPDQPWWPYNGTVPAPGPLQGAIGRLWFRNLSSPETIKRLISLVYTDRSMIDDAFLGRIAASARHPLALEAFASIIFSPKPIASFASMCCASQAPICLIYGQEDPWIVPLWAQRLKRQLPSAQYYELSPAGHCPNHEVPVTVSTLLRDWIRAEETGCEVEMEELREVLEEDGRRITITQSAGLPRTLFERVDRSVWDWQQRGNQEVV